MSILDVRSLQTILEEALVADPDNLLHVHALADHLIEQDDPRGQLMQLQLALDNPHLNQLDRAELLRAEREWTITHCREFLGDLADVLLDERRLQYHHFRFRYGWLDELRMPSVYGEAQQLMPRSPTLRMLRSLNLDGQEGFLSFRGCQNLSNLRRLVIGHNRRDRYEFALIHEHGLIPVLDVLPRLEQLDISSLTDFDQFGRSELAPLLWELHVGISRPEHLAEILENDVRQKLQVLHLRWGSHRVRSRDQFEFFWTTDHLPLLRELTLDSFPFGTRDVQRMIDSGFLSRLEKLTLHSCPLDETTLLHLGSIAGKLGRLQHLALERGTLEQRNPEISRHVIRLRHAGVPIFSDA